MAGTEVGETGTDWAWSLEASSRGQAHGRRDVEAGQGATPQRRAALSAVRRSPRTHRGGLVDCSS